MYARGPYWRQNPGYMKDSQILSGFQDLTGVSDTQAPQASAGKVPVFDACQLGVVLRAVLFVQTATGVAAMYGATGFMEWVGRFSLFTGAAMPATLIWLLLGCALRHAFARWELRWQYLAGIALGALAGLLGCAVLWAAGLWVQTQWLAGASSGALLSAVLVMGLDLRSRGRAPANEQARLRELQSRIRPHFLFNTLNSAIALVRAEPQRAERLLEDLSELFRQALRDLGDAVPLADEIALARRYLAIEEVRFGERLRVQWSLDPAADAARLPPLLLQPLVENAVRHGVEPSAEGADLHISTQRRGATVVIRVSNTFPAGQGEGGAGLALRNVHDRLLLLHDVQASMRYGVKDGQYQVRMEIPA